MPRSHNPDLCPDCQRARAFVESVIGTGPAVETDIDDFIASLASLLDTALGHLLREIDCEAEPERFAASAARLVALCADQLHRLDLHGAQRERLVARLREEVAAMTARRLGRRTH